MSESKDNLESVLDTQKEVIKLPDFKKFEKRIIKVKRFNPSFLMSKYEEVFSDASTGVGAFIDSNTGRTVRPLSREEEFVIMPEILNLRMDAQEFNAALEEYFASIDIKVPEEGIILDISIASEKEVETYNGEKLKIDFPVNTIDYVNYKFLQKCIEKGFKVAPSYKDCIVNVHEFYIEDVEQDNKEKNKFYKDKQRVNLAFLNLTLEENAENNKEKIEMLFDMTFDIHGQHSYNTKLPDIIRILDEKVLSEKPELLAKLMIDENLADKALINRLLIHNVISKQGIIYFIDATSTGDLHDTIQYMNNPLNAGIKEKLRVKLEQKLRLK